MADVMDLVSSTRAGRAGFKAVRPILHLVRRMAHPGIPNDLKIAKVAYRDRQFSILHRRWSSSDALAIKQCFEQLQYDMPTGVHGKQIERIYREILDAGQKPLIVDCGANIGASVTWFSSRYPAAHIVAVEPAPDNFALLERNCTGLDVDLRKAGIGPQDGVAYVENTGAEMCYRTNTDQKGISINMVSLRTLLASKPQSQYVPFLLKIDIEGAEKTLFCGDTSVFNLFPLIIFEPHDWMFPGQLTSQEFFRFHVAAGREFGMNHENIASITPPSNLVGLTPDLKN